MVNSTSDKTSNLATKKQFNFLVLDLSTTFLLNKYSEYSIKRSINTTKTDSKGKLKKNIKEVIPEHRAVIDDKNEDTQVSFNPRSTKNKIKKEEEKRKDYEITFKNYIALFLNEPKKPLELMKIKNERNKYILRNFKLFKDFICGFSKESIEDCISKSFKSEHDIHKYQFFISKKLTKSFDLESLKDRLIAENKIHAVIILKNDAISSLLNEINNENTSSLEINVEDMIEEYNEYLNECIRKIKGYFNNLNNNLIIFHLKELIERREDKSEIKDKNINGDCNNILNYEYFFYKLYESKEDILTSHNELSVFSKYISDYESSFIDNINPFFLNYENKVKTNRIDKNSNTIRNKALAYCNRIKIVKSDEIAIQKEKLNTQDNDYLDFDNIKNNYNKLSIPNSTDKSIYSRFKEKSYFRVPHSLIEVTGLSIKDRRVKIKKASKSTGKTISNRSLKQKNNLNNSNCVDKIDNNGNECNISKENIMNDRKESRLSNYSDVSLSSNITSLTLKYEREELSNKYSKYKTSGIWKLNIKENVDDDAINNKIFLIGLIKGCFIVINEAFEVIQEINIKPYLPEFKSANYIYPSMNNTSGNHAPELCEVLNDNTLAFSVYQKRILILQVNNISSQDPVVSNINTLSYSLKNINSKFSYTIFYLGEHSNLKQIKHLSKSYIATLSELSCIKIFNIQTKQEIKYYKLYSLTQPRNCFFEIHNSYFLYSDAENTKIFDINQDKIVDFYKNSFPVVYLYKLSHHLNVFIQINFDCSYNFLTLNFSKNKLYHSSQIHKRNFFSYDSNSSYLDIDFNMIKCNFLDMHSLFLVNTGKAIAINHFYFENETPKCKLLCLINSSLPLYNWIVEDEYMIIIGKSFFTERKCFDIESLVLNYREENKRMKLENSTKSVKYVNHSKNGKSENSQNFNIKREKNLINNITIETLSTRVKFNSDTNQISN